MKKHSQWLSLVFLTIFVILRLIMAFKPFEHQRYEPDPVATYEFLQSQRTQSQNDFLRSNGFEPMPSFIVPGAE